MLASLPPACLTAVFQALLSSHDSIAQVDYGPVLPPLPDDVPEDEEAMRIVCLVKNNQPLVSSPLSCRFRGDGSASAQTADFRM